MRTWIGMDVGGTKLLIGEMDERGILLRVKRYATGYQNQETAAGGILAALEDYLDSVGFAGEPAALGLGIVGIVNSAEGVWLAMDHIRKSPVALAPLLSAKSGLPAFLDNDVRCATTAELLFGAGRETGHFLYVNVGTGIAAGCVTGGRILRGANHNSGEVGHIVVSPELGIPCACGRVGCVEPIASGGGLSERIRTAQAADVRTTIPKARKGKGTNIPALFRCADAGDPLAAQLTEEAAEALARLVMNLVRVSDPDKVVMGGGIVSDGWMLARMLPHLQAATMRGVTRGVVLSQLDPDLTGLVGACAVAMQGRPT